MPFYRSLDPELSQGDILVDVPHLSIRPPITVLRSSTGRGGAKLYQPYEHGSAAPPPGGFRLTQQGEDVVSSCQMAWGIVLTHSCEIDKPDTKLVSVLLVRSLRPLPEATQATIREGRNYSTFFLPASSDGQFNESFIDFRRVTCIDRAYIGPETRLFSLSDEAVRAFLAKFFLYITRADVYQIEELLTRRANA